MRDMKAYKNLVKISKIKKCDKKSIKSKREILKDQKERQKI